MRRGMWKVRFGASDLLQVWGTEYVIAEDAETAVTVARKAAEDEAAAQESGVTLVLTGVELIARETAVALEV